MRPTQKISAEKTKTIKIHEKKRTTQNKNNDKKHLSIFLPN
jgi:hypothetical protein